MSVHLQIAVVGSCNVDHITYSTRFPIPGETIYGRKYVRGLGGKGANQCVAAGKLGAKVAMIGKIGQDNDGESYLKEFKSLGVDTEFLKQTDLSATGIATIIVDNKGTNSIIIVPGANLLIEPVDVISAKQVINSASVVICQNEIPLEVTLKALQVGKSLGKFTIFNPAPAPLQELDRQYYSLSDIICCNEVEAFALTGVKITTIEDAKVAAEKLVSKGCNSGVITLGEQGCVFAEKGKYDSIHIKTSQVKPIDTTGAGDAFVGALAFFIVYLPNISFTEKLKRACYFASVTVCKKGTQSSYPNKSDLDQSVFNAANFSC